MERVTAVFTDRASAESAVAALRARGIADAHLPFVSRDAAENSGAGAGALFGLAAALIPGVGPFITAGWLSALGSAVAGGVAAGALVGGTSGAIACAFANAGYSHDEANGIGI